MSDHLATLARRALQPSRIHPRVRSRFESEPAVAIGLEVTVDAAAAPPELAAQPVARAPQTAVVQPEVSLAAPLPRPAAQPLQPEATISSAMARPQPPADTSSARMTSSLEPASATGPRNPAVVPEPALKQPVEHLESLRIEREVHERVELREARLQQREVLQQILEQRVERIDLVQPQVHAQASTPHLPQVAQRPGLPATPADAPRVEISIGRIEVLPLESAAAPRPKESPQRQPAQSLETYLQERNGAGNGRGGRG